VLGRQWLPVQGVRENDLVAKRLVQGKASLVVVLVAILHPFVKTGEEHFGGTAEDARLLKHRPQGNAGPDGGADRLQYPGLTDRPRQE